MRPPLFAKTPKSSALFSSAHYRLTPDMCIETLDGQRVLNGFSISYAHCETYCLTSEPVDPDRIELEHSDGLAIGDQVLITNSMYGGGSRSAFQRMVTIKSINDNSVSFSPELPPHIMRYTKSLFVLKHEQPRSVLPSRGSLVSDNDDGAAAEFVYECEDFVCRLQLVMSSSSPKIDVVANVDYLKPCKLFNLSLVFDSAIPLREAYLKNRTILDLKANPLKRDLWLWKEGCRATKKGAGWSVLHTPQVASCEIITRGHGFPYKSIQPHRQPVFVVNLEHYNAQHFRLHREFITEKFSTFSELSCPKLARNQHRSYKFSMHIGESLCPQPRLMLTPSGYRAVNVWTEHADKTTLETHRASYFGHESITCAADAVGGFVKHGHVVTKSIFCENPKEYQNKVIRNGDRVQIGPMLAIAESPEFVEMLDELHDLGHEICVHAIRPDPDKDLRPDGMHAKIDTVYDKYNSPSWIDHALESIEFCAGFEGLVDQSPWCMRDAWKRNGVRYFWSWSSADFMPKGKDIIDLLHNDGNGSMPTPLYWRHPILPDDAVVWSANECQLEYFSDQVIDQLIVDRGVSIQQHYYPFLSCEAHSFGFIDLDENGHYQTTPEFEHMLEYMSQRQDEGELLITTIDRIVSYWLNLEGVSHTLLSNDRFEICNENAHTIEGFAFVVHAQRIDTDSTQINQRPIDNGDILVWFDMPASGRMIFRTTAHA